MAGQSSPAARGPRVLIPILVLGVYPNLIFDITDPVLTSMGETFQAMGP